MMAAAMVAGVALTTGCSKRDEVQEQRRELTQARQEAQKETAEIRQEADRERAAVARDEQEKLAAAREEVADEQKELAEAERDLARNQREDTAGNTVAAGTTVQGRMRSTRGDSLVLIVPGNNNAELKLKTDDQTRVMQNDLPVNLDDLKEGTEVRASYVSNGDDLVARDVVIVTPIKK
jgi:flagellar biosynthesis GTPase FlhF